MKESRRQREHDALPCYLYIIKPEARDMPVKLGISRHPFSRLANMQGGSPVRLVIASVLYFERRVMAYQVEQAAQVVIAASNAWGEWFNVDTARALGAVQQAAQALGVAPCILSLDELRAVFPDWGSRLREVK